MPPENRPPPASTGRAGARDLAAAALAAGNTVKAAAAAARVGERTLRQWLAEDAAFAAGVAGRRAAMVSQAGGKLADAMTAAADVLRALLRHKDPNVRHRAASRLIELGVKVVELSELERRVAELEARAARGRGDPGRAGG